MSGHYTANGVFVGGQPGKVRTDRGSNFVARATSLGLVAANIERKYSEPYTPQQNGKIERWHRFKSRLKKLPGFDWTEYKQGDPRKAAQAPPREDLLTFEELVVEVARVVRTYNTKRVHRAHKLTPVDCWEREVAANEDLVRFADAVAVRAAMRQQETRLLRRRRIEFGSRFYNMHPQSVHDDDEDPEVIARRNRRIDATEGKQVSVRFLHGRIEYVSVYTQQGEYLGDAVWDEIQTVKQAGETAQRRRMHIKAMKLDIESIAKADAEAIASRRAEALDSTDAGNDHYDQYDDPTPPTASPGRKSRTTKTPTRAGSKASSGPTRREIEQERRRKEIQEEQTWRRDRSA